MIEPVGFSADSRRRLSADSLRCDLNLLLESSGSPRHLPFTPVERSLARALLLLANYGRQDFPLQVVPTIPPDTLAKMIGTSRAAVDSGLSRFRALGLIEYDGTLTVNTSLVGVALQG